MSPAWMKSATSAARASTRSPVASSPRCTAAGSGRCASTPASRPPRTRTAASATSSSRVRPGLSVAFDLPTQMGYDSDAPEAEGEVGRVGVPISSLADMEVLLDGLPLETVSTSMTINASAAVLLALYVATAEKQGVARAKVSGTTQNDILKEYIARGTYIFPPRPSMRLVTDIFEFCSQGAAPLEHDQHQRLPHAGGRGHGSPGAGLHPRGRHRLRRGGPEPRPRHRRLRRPTELLLRLLERAVRGSGQVPGRPADVGPDRQGTLWGRQQPLHGLPLPRPDRRLVAYGPVDRQQRGPDHSPGPGRGPGRGSEPPHQLPRRGAGAAHGRGGPPRPPDPADPGLRIRGDGDPGSAGRQLLRRVA